MLMVLLYGHLGARFGRVHRYDARTPGEAVRALCATLPGFRQALIEGGAYRVLRGGREALGADDLRTPHSERDTLRIVPVVAGAGKGLGSILLGAALVGLSLWMPPVGFGAAGSFTATIGNSVMRSIGTSLIFGGVSQALASTPKSQQVEAVSNKPSYAFDGAVNTAAQGNPVPVCYGRLIVGSQVISAGLSVEQIP